MRSVVIVTMQLGLIGAIALPFGGAGWSHAASALVGAGIALGIWALSANRPGAGVGVTSFVNAIAMARGCHHVLEPQQHVMNVFPFGAAAGFTSIDYGSQWAFNLALIEIVPPVVPGSLPAFPFSLLCFPDIYAPSIIVHAWPLFGTWGSFPMIAIPPGWAGKVLYQSIGFGGSGFELSTPAVIDVQ